MFFDKDDLKEMPHRAQLATLNPSLPAKLFVDFGTMSLGLANAL